MGKRVIFKITKDKERENDRQTLRERNRERDRQTQRVILKSYMNVPFTDDF